ncbi:MAG: dynamin family protein [Clostridium neonatale]
MNRQKRIDRVVRELGVDRIINKNILIKERVVNPSHYVVMLGETSSGKSTLINSLFENKVLIESVKPTTSVITEVAISNSCEEMCFLINKDSTYRIIEKEEFDKLVVNPPENLHRLRYIGECKNEKYDNLRLFDTPGYGSLESYHEEVLKEFIPESDFIVYVVSYKVGFGDYDYQFLKYVAEAIDKDVEIVLAVNMCPSGVNEENKRIKEIKSNFEKCTNRDPNTFLIESSIDKIPDATKLYDYIYERINSEDKKEELAKTLKSYQDFILNECNIKINSKIANIEAKRGDIKEIANIYSTLLDKKSGIIENIERGYTKIKLNTVKYIDKSALNVKEEISKIIYDESKWSKKEETLNLMEHYYVPKFTNEQTDDLINYTEDEIISLERKIDEVLEASLNNLKERVRINIPSYSEVMVNVIDQHLGDEIKKMTGELLRQSEHSEEQAKNSTYKNLKRLKVNNESIKTDHNRKQFFKVIRATSIKAITEYLAVFTESIFSLFQSINWQKSVEDMAVNAVDRWANDLEYAVKKYLDVLRDKKKSQIVALYNELSHEFKNDGNELENINSEELLRLKNEIDFLLNKCLLITLNKKN